MVYTALKTPGVYVNEVSVFPPSVAQVPTAIPGFVGYTEKAMERNGEDLTMKPKKISSLVDYQFYFGGSPGLDFTAVELGANNEVAKVTNTQTYFLYDALQLFFGNGGGECYIISVGSYKDDVVFGDTTTPAGLRGGLEVLKEVDEPTMILFPDAMGLDDSGDITDLQQQALIQCAELMDRVAIFDIEKAENKDEHKSKIDAFRNGVGMDNLKYGAAYTPWIKVKQQKDVRYRDIKDVLFQAGTTTPVDLRARLGDIPAADRTTLTNQINTLNEVVSDNLFIKTRIDDYRDSGADHFAEYTADGTTNSLPTLSQGFQALVQSVRSKMAAAEASGLKVDVTKAAEELVKVVGYIYNIVFLIDDFGFKGDSFMSNQRVVDNTHRAIGFDLPVGPLPDDAPATFLEKLTSLVTWDGTLTDDTIHAITEDDLAETEQEKLGIDDADFQTFNLVATVSDDTILENATPVSAPQRIANQRAALTDLLELFTYFNNILTNVTTFAVASEKAAEDALKSSWPVYKGIIEGVNNSISVLPPSGAVAGIYARVDNERGVWKAPANVTVLGAKGTAVNINDKMQESINVDVDAGKSVNAIRVFSGKGTMVWGARTLAGNDNEWRYVPVRRFFNMVEESVKKSSSWVVFEPNDANTWIKVKAMINNFLTLLWRQGALAGAKPEEAFFVEVGLNKTMTFVDILEGRMIIKIGMAVVRPAEFIILEFSHKVQTS